MKTKHLFIVTLLALLGSAQAQRLTGKATAPAAAFIYGETLTGPQKASLLGLLDGGPVNPASIGLTSRGSIAGTEGSFTGDLTAARVVIDGKPVMKYGSNGNIFFGETGNTGASGYYNQAGGFASMANLTTGVNNVSWGPLSQRFMVSGSGNTSNGTQSMEDGVSLVDCSAYGHDSLRRAVSGVGGSAFGRLALEQALVAGNNSAFGDSSLRRVQGIGNSAMGYTTAENVLSVSYSTYMGAGAGKFLTSGNEAVVIGYAAMGTNSGGGVGNTVAGAFGGQSLTSATYNTFAGWGAGNNPAQKPDVTNSIAVGRGAYTTRDNQTVIGNTATQAANLYGSVGIGIGLSLPDAALHVRSVDALNVLGLAGTTNGLRVETSATGAAIRGVDATLAASYQPLTIGGSQLIFETAGTNEAGRFFASGNLGLGTNTDAGATLAMRKASAPAILLDLNNGTVADGEVIGKIEFATNDLSAGITAGPAARIAAVAEAGGFGVDQAITFSTRRGSAGTALRQVAAVTAEGDVEIATISKGIILKSPDGTRYRITIANGGTLTITGL